MYGLPRVLEGGGEEKGDRAKVTVCFLMLQEHGSSGGSSGRSSTPWDAGFTSYLIAFFACRAGYQACFKLHFGSSFLLE